MIVAACSAGASLTCVSDPRIGSPTHDPGGDTEPTARDPAAAAQAFERALARAEADPRGALMELDLAIAADPDHALARLHAAELRLELTEELPRADADLVRAMALLPENPRAHLRAGQVAHALEDDARAARLLARAAELRPDWPEPQLGLIDVLTRLDRPEDAVAAARRAVELAPERLDVATRLAEALARAGHLTEAAREMEAAAIRFGGSGPLLRRAAALWERAGGVAEAAYLRARADRVDPPPKATKKRGLLPARRP